jgi:hypothetical protein
MVARYVRSQIDDLPADGFRLDAQRHSRERKAGYESRRFHGMILIAQSKKGSLIVRRPSAAGL